VQASEEEEKKRVKVAWYLTSLSIWARNSLSLKKLFHWLSSFMLSGYSKKGRSRKMKEKMLRKEETPFNRGLRGHPQLSGVPPSPFHRQTGNTGPYSSLGSSPTASSQAGGDSRGSTQTASEKFRSWSANTPRGERKEGITNPPAERSEVLVIGYA